MTYRYNKIFIALVIIGLVAACGILGQRFQVEQNNRTVELVLDYEDIVELAEVEGVPLAPLLEQFRQAGLTSLAVYETTLEKLSKNGKITAVPGTSILHQYREGTLSDPFWRNLAVTGKIQSEDTYVIGNNDQVFAEVKSDLERRLSPARVQQLTDGDFPVLAVKANYEKIVKWNLGLPTDEMNTVAAHGFYVVARPTNYTKVRSEDVQAVFDRIRPIDKVSSIMFVGDEVTGYPGLLPEVAAQMKAKDLNLDMIENPVQLQFVKQDGLLPLAALNDYRAARVYVIPKDEQPKLKLDEAVHRWVLADEERNIRVNLLRKYDKPAQGMTLLETNLTYIRDVTNLLKENDFTVGRASVYAPYYPGSLLLGLIILGSWAAVCLLVSAIRPVPDKYLYLLLIVPTAIMLFPIIQGSGTLMRQLAATVSAVTLPVLAMTYQLDKWRQTGPQERSIGKILRGGLANLTVAVAIAMVGGLYVAALLGDVRFFLEMEYYRGVKITFVLPLLLIFIVYLTRFNLFGQDRAQKIWPQIQRMLNATLDMKTMLAFACVVVIAWVYIGRSGHTAGVPVPEIEIKVRAFLENVMAARPREKEFMIGHPAFLLAAMAFYQRWPRIAHFALVITATIGLGSLVETFAHIHTPVLMSFVRGIDGLVVGAVFGVIAVGGAQVIRVVSERAGRRTSTDE